MGDLQASEDASNSAKTSAESLRPYEEKYYAALKELDNYIATSSKKSATAIAPTAETTPGGPKLNACKLLFLETLTKAKSPEEFRPNPKFLQGIRDFPAPR